LSSGILQSHEFFQYKDFRPKMAYKNCISLFFFACDIFILNAFNFSFFAKNLDVNIVGRELQFEFFYIVENKIRT